METDDHDILIEIRTKVNLFNDSFAVHCAENAANDALFKKSIETVHFRVDNLVRYRDMMSGAFAFLGIIGIITSVVMALLKASGFWGN